MRLVLSTILFLIAYSLLGQVTGKVLDANGQPIPFATVGWDGTSVGSQTDEQGWFKLPPAQNSNQLIITAMGYKSVKRTIDSSGDFGAITMEENSLGLNEVVITGTQYETFVKASPVKVEVVTSDFLQRNFAPTNIVEGISQVNGVREVVACGVCYTNSISINGLPGPYTAILMDGAPIYGNLAATYGLNGIPTSIIERFEVIKGPSSTLYGSEALAGVINIITKDPSDHPLVSIDLMGTSHLESFGNLAFSPRTEKSQGYIGLNYAYINDFDDWNRDGFGDMASLDRVSLFTRWNIFRPSGKTFTLAGKLYYEDRRNGVHEYMKDRNYRSIRGSEDIYGESIYTYRSEIFGRYQFAEDINFDYSFSHHIQDSYYGADHYDATQTVLFGNLTWNKTLNDHRLLGGLTLRGQLYDDNTQATVTRDGINDPDNQVIPGIFLQDEWTSSEKLSVLGGLRADYHIEHNLQLSPRLSLKYNPFRYTTFRLNTGTGFKVVNLFTEDHAFITGQRQVIIEEKLSPEESVNVTFNTNHLFTWKESQGMIDVDLYYTLFTNKIIPDYDTPGQIIYRNTDNHAVTKGISVSINQEWAGGLSSNVGATIQKAYQVEDNSQSLIEFAPDWSGVFTLNYNFSKANITLAYTGNLTGPMQLPAVYDLNETGSPTDEPRPVRSEPFAFHNLQVQKDFSNEWSVYAGVQNIFNYRQVYSPLSGYNDPNYASGFSPFFDTSYSFSPLHGREFYLGIRFNPSK